MKKISTLLGLLLFTSFAMHAQYAFKVLAAKGSNKLLKNGSWTDLSAGTKINSDQKLKVVSGGYLGLIHSTGKTFEIEKSGEFSISKLESQVIKGKAGFGEKYANFVAEGMFSSNENASQFYDRTGSVIRDVIKKTPIVLYANKEIAALKSKPVTLEWNDCGNGNHQYIVTFKNLFNEDIYSDTSSTNSYTVNFNDARFDQKDEDEESVKGTFLVEIRSLSDRRYTSNTPSVEREGEDNPVYFVKFVNKEKALEIEKEINPILENMNPNSSVDHLYLAMAYEKQGLMAYAVDSYTKAHKLSNVDAYKQQHDEYIKYKLQYDNLKGSLDDKK